jgi:hypothetical protein
MSRDRRRSLKANRVCRDLRRLRQDDFTDREGEGVPLVPKAGEVLFQLKKQPQWAGGE